MFIYFLSLQPHSLLILFANTFKNTFSVSFGINTHWEFCRLLTDALDFRVWSFYRHSFGCYTSTSKLNFSTLMNNNNNYTCRNAVVLVMVHKIPTEHKTTKENYFLCSPFSYSIQLLKRWDHSKFHRTDFHSPQAFIR